MRLTSPCAGSACHGPWRPYQRRISSTGSGATIAKRYHAGAAAAVGGGRSAMVKGDMLRAAVRPVLFVLVPALLGAAAAACASAPPRAAAASAATVPAAAPAAALATAPQAGRRYAV